MAEFEKNPGPDWEVMYEYEGEEAEMMAVFGFDTLEDALREAHRSLSAADTPYTILGIARADCLAD